MKALGLSSSEESPTPQGAQHRILPLGSGALLLAIASGSETGWDSGCTRISEPCLDALLRLVPRFPQAVAAVLAEV